MRWIGFRKEGREELGGLKHRLVLGSKPPPSPPLEVALLVKVLTIIPSTAFIWAVVFVSILRAPSSSPAPKGYSAVPRRVLSASLAGRP